MRLRIRRYWEKLRTSYWFLPMLMLGGSVALAWLTLYLDEEATAERLGLSWVFRGGAEGARVLLSTLAGATITVAGVIFSITVVALSMASQQFGPRLLQRFRVDLSTQLTLGTLLSSFVFCLAILRVVPRAAASAGVPVISITAAVLLSSVSFLMLIYFIHHLTSIIQVDQVVSDVEHDLVGSIERYYPEQFGELPRPGHDPEQDLPPDFQEGSRAALAARSGYVQGIEHPKVMRLAGRHDLIIRLNYRAGHFVVRRSDLARVWPARRASDPVLRSIQECFAIANTRTPTQDVSFSINQVVQIALRALSPSLNDPFTAITCVDYLGAAMARCAALPSACAHHYDGEGRLRVISRPEGFAGLLSEAFSQVRQAATGNVAVSLRLLETFVSIMRQADGPEKTEAVKRKAEIVRRWALDFIKEPADREAIETRFAWVLEQARPNLPGPS